jgi:hypothetical protein
MLGDSQTGRGFGIEARAAGLLLQIPARLVHQADDPLQLGEVGVMTQLYAITTTSTLPRRPRT